MSDGEYGVDWAAVDDEGGRASEYLECVAGLDAIERHKRRTRRLLDPERGDRILDAGCGLGDDVLALAERVGPEGRAVGVDRSEPLVAEASARAATTDRAAFQVADVMQLPFPDDGFDACRAERVLQHLSDPRGALREMCRVTRPVGTVIVTDPDWETLAVDALDADSEVCRRVTDGRWAASRNPKMGNRLYLLARDAGLTDVTVHPATMVFTDFETANEVLSLADRLDRMAEADVISATRAEQWLSDVRCADAADRFYSSVTGFTVAGTAPGDG